MLERIYTIDLDIMGVRRGQRVLDLGCGTGRHLIQAMQRPIQVVGVDIDFEELRAGKYLVWLRGPEYPPDASLNLLVGDGGRLPFPDASFDHVLCSETLEHLPDPIPIIDEAIRVLKPNGSAAFSVPDVHVETAMKGLCDVLGLEHRYARFGHLRIFKRGELARLLARRGLAPYRVVHREALESCYWLWWLLFQPDRPPARHLDRALARVLRSRPVRCSRAIGAAEYLFSIFWAKSVVVYTRKPGERAAATGSGALGEGRVPPSVLDQDARRC